MDRKSFPGFPAYIAAAAERLSLSTAAAEIARRQPAIHACSTLVAQAIHRPPSPGRTDTINHARRLRDALRLAYEAATAIVAEIDPPPMPVPAPSDETETVREPVIPLNPNSHRHGRKDR